MSCERAATGPSGGRRSTYSRAPVALAVAQQIGEIRVAAAELAHRERLLAPLEPAAQPFGQTALVEALVAAHVDQLGGEARAPAPCRARSYHSAARAREASRAATTLRPPDGAAVTPLEMLALGAAATAAGVVNTLAGGGSLLTVPLLVLLGSPGRHRERHQPRRRPAPELRRGLALPRARRRRPARGRARAAAGRRRLPARRLGHRAGLGLALRARLRRGDAAAAGAAAARAGARRGASARRTPAAAGCRAGP